MPYQSYAASLSPLRAPPALLFTACYAVAVTVGYRRTVAIFGRENSGGSPRWRNALGTLTQWVTMPSLLLSRLLLAPAQTYEPIVDSCFVNVFASFMLFDFAVLDLNPMMIAHHGTCLLGHLYAACTAPEAFVHYFTSVVALELGSGCSCVWWLWGELKGRYPRMLTPLYVLPHRHTASAWHISMA